MLEWQPVLLSGYQGPGVRSGPVKERDDRGSLKVAACGWFAACSLTSDPVAAHHPAPPARGPRGGGLRRQGQGQPGEVVEGYLA